MDFLSVCSGIEAASVAWQPLGWKAVAFSEIEPFPCAVLAHHYPDTPNWGDMTKFEEWPDVAIDLLCGGTPCQSFSVAGLRKGLADQRGNLMLTYGAIAAKYRPRWLVWENVPGVLSSNGGRDFASFLGLLSGQAIRPPADGWGNTGIVAGIPDAYGLAYRVLDAQYFGVPQRRRRVFVVGCLGDWRAAAAVLLERHSLQGHPAPRRDTRAGTAVGALAGTSPGGGWRIGADEAAAGQLVPELFCAATGQAAAEMAAEMAPTLSCNHEAPYIAGPAHTLRGEGFDASEDGTGRGTPLVPVAFDTTQITSAANYSNPKPGDPCHPLAAGMHPPAIAFDCKSSGQNGFGIAEELAGTQRAMGHAGSHSNGGGHQAVAYSTKLHNTASNQAGKVYEEYTAGLDHNSPPPALLTAMQVRRLTPRECERLQAFPDNYTLVQHGARVRPEKLDADWVKYLARGNPKALTPEEAAGLAADGPRYKALGNSWCVTNVRWIGQRVAQVDALMRSLAAGRLLDGVTHDGFPEVACGT